MMNNKPTINDILNDLGFTKREKDSFKECIKAVKKEQQDEDYNAEEEIASIIEEVVKNDF